MIVATASATGAGVVGYEMFKLLAKDIYEKAKQATSDKRTIAKIAFRPEAVARKIKQYGKVKTLLNLERAVDIQTFYHPASVKLGNNRAVVESFATIKRDRNIILEGVAGQGKSVLLRYLCVEELNRGEYFPVFIELRDLSGEMPIRDAATKYFDLLAIPLSDGVWNDLCAGGKMLLLLDGFDEIPEMNRKAILKELDALSIKYPDLPIVVSSRPNCEIHASSFFETIKVSDLKGDEYAAVIRKLMGNGPTADSLIQRVESNKNKIAGVLTTPLLVTLLVFTYRTFQEIPSRMAEFYDALFQLLLQRHDGMKPTNTRQRKCKLNDSDCRRLFEFFCFAAKGTPNALSSELKLLEVITAAVRGMGITADPALFLDDIVRITCLLLKDGDRYRFVHRSVQEYYSACYIWRSAEPIAKEFYEHIIADAMAFHRWRGELEFLSQIDQYRYNQYYILASASRYFNLPDYSLTESNLDKTIAYGREKLNSILVHIRWINDSEVVGTEASVPQLGAFYDEFMRHVMARVLSGPFSRNVMSHREKILASPLVKHTPLGNRDRINTASATFGAFAQEIGDANLAEKELKQWAMSVLGTARKSEEFIRNQSNTASVSSVLKGFSAFDTSETITFGVANFAR